MIAIKIAIKTYFRSYDIIGSTRPLQVRHGSGQNWGRLRADWTVVYYPPLQSGNYWEGHPSQPPGVGEAFKKLFCWRLMPAAPDRG
ncbi:hypothetical protein TNCV_2154461 [Trichonephila clavipes]|nr:hypothetical protein TNCV_2154461 [Trichonephila clavipes]